MALPVRRIKGKPLSRRRPVKTDDVFLLHAANRAFLDGKRRLPVGLARPHTWLMGVIALFCAVPTLVLLGWALWDEYQFQRLQAHGVKGVATVARLPPPVSPVDSSDDDVYTITYKYAVNG